MKLKKILALSLAALFCMALLAACGTPAPDPDASPANGEVEGTPDVLEGLTPAPTVFIPGDIEAGGFPHHIGDPEDMFEPVPADTEGAITVWMDDAEVFEAIYEAWQQDFPNITLNFEQTGNVDSRARVSLAGPAGIGPDIFFMPHDHITPAMQDGSIAPIRPALQNTMRTLIDDKGLSVVTIENTDGAMGTNEVTGEEEPLREMFAVPSSRENVALFYNRDVWGNNPPTTMDEVIARADEFNDPARNSWTLGWNVGDAFMSYFWLSAFGFRVFGEDMNDPTNPGFDSPEVAQGLEKMVSMRELVLNIPFGETGIAQLESSFEEGLLPLMINGPWAIPRFRNAGVNFGIAPIPTIDGNTPRPFYGAIIAAISSYVSEENLPLAETFVWWYCGYAGVQAKYEARGNLPALSDELLEEHLPELWENELLVGILAQNEYTDPMPTILEVAQMWNPMAMLFQNPWNGEMSIEETQQAAMIAYVDLLDVLGRDTSWFERP